jgi:large subunit ribosomal protein L29
MELAKIRNLSDEELKHQEKADGEQLFRLRFQLALGQNDGVKKLRQLRKEIAQLKTVARERQLGIHGESKDARPAVTIEATAVKAEEPAAKPKATKAKKAASDGIEPKAPRAKKPAAAKTKTEKAKGASK